MFLLLFYFYFKIGSKEGQVFKVKKKKKKKIESIHGVLTRHATDNTGEVRLAVLWVPTCGSIQYVLNAAETATFF